MGFFSNLFNKKKKNENVGGMEDYMMLIRVYLQSAMAAKLGITSLSAFPDLAAFKRSLKVATVNNKLGVGEKKACGKMLRELYGVSDVFLEEIDQSLKKGCRTVNDVRNYTFLFQGFSQDLIMLVSNLMKWKLRAPLWMKSVIISGVQKTVKNIYHKDLWKDDSIRKSVFTVRQYAQRLAFTEQWTAEYATKFILLAKKEPKPSKEEMEKAEKMMKK